MAYFGVSLKNNEEQQELARLISTNDKAIIFCEGKAGTGKTFATLVAALQLKNEKRFEKIIYARNPVQIGEDMGFLPGTIEEKYHPFMGGLLDNLESIARLSSFHPNVGDLRSKVDIMPIAFLRGRSFENTILIIDEAQNLSIVELQTILTRIGNYSKVILLGSVQQIDDIKQRKKSKCDFQRLYEGLEDLPYVSFIRLEKSMRSKWCAEVDEIIEQIKKEC